MSRALLFMSGLGLFFLLGGALLFPQSSVFWLASAASGYEAIRLLLSLLLFVQFMTRPPRNVFLRALSLTTALVVAGWVVQATLAYHMMALDSLSLLAAAISIGVTALEMPTYRHKVLHIPVIQL